MYQMILRITVELKRQIEKEADKRGISFNGMVNIVIFEGLKVIRQ